VEDLFGSPTSNSNGIKGYKLLNQSEQSVSMSKPLSAQEEGYADEHDEREPYGEPVIGGGGRDRSASKLSTGSRQGQAVVIIDDEEEDEHEAHSKMHTKELIEESLDFEELESTIWKKVNYILFLYFNFILINPLCDSIK